jgi:hypothetical protein
MLGGNFSAGAAARLLAFGAINHDNEKGSTDLVRGIPLPLNPSGKY